MSKTLSEFDVTVHNLSDRKRFTYETTLQADQVEDGNLRSTRVFRDLDW